jgi:HAD superfamily hydrolase (TIGR01509 family)
MLVKKGFIFDLDGTLIDNMMIHHHAWQRHLLSLGMELSLEEVRETIHGKNDEILLRLFGSKYSREERKKIAAEKELQYRIISSEGLSAINGLEKFLVETKNYGIPYGIGTAGPPENAKHGLESSGIDHFFDVVVDSSMVSRGKPDPEVFVQVAERVGLLVQNCLVFEDSPIGVATALNAGCKVIVVTTTHSPSEFASFPNIVKYIGDYSEISVAEALNFI